MRAVIVGAGMGGLMTALALRQSSSFSSIDVYEQTNEPATAGAELNILLNGAWLCRWLGVDLDGGDPKGPHGGRSMAAARPFWRRHASSTRTAACRNGRSIMCPPWATEPGSITCAGWTF